MAEDQQKADWYWRRTSTLMWIMFALWVFFSFVVHFFVEPLNAYKFLGFPLGFYMAAQGSLICFVVMLFLFAKRQDTIDREEGVAEDR
jgi:putative solute:sodium symporter small subunit